jgi:cell division protease FtsH
VAKGGNNDRTGDGKGGDDQRPVTPITDPAGQH